MTPEQRDEIMRIAADAKPGEYFGWLDDSPLSRLNDYIDSITAPEGWQLVPVEPTEAMCDAAWASEGTDYVGEHHRIWQFAPAYRAALAAAPKPGGSNE